MSRQIDLVMTLVTVMDDDEKGELLRKLATLVGMNVRSDEELAALPAPAKAVAKGASRAKKKRPYWLRTVTSVDTSNKGAEQLVGDWANDMGDVDYGGHLFCGTRWGVKKYYWLERKHGAVSKFVGGFEIEDAVIAKEWDTFADAAKELSKII